MVEPVSPPGAHVYVVALVAVSIAELPEQIVEDGEALTPTTGGELTVTTTVCVLVAGQPAAEVPLTV